ncbi:MAG: VWA domain-containing protein [Pseudomonadota bacterium]
MSAELSTGIAYRMRRSVAAAALAVVAAISGPVAAFANDVCHEEAMLVFDASGSMATRLPGANASKIDIARRAAADVLPDITAQRATGLVTYGGIPGSACNSVNLRLPPMSNSADLILAELLTLSPSGQTALSQATWLAAQTIDRKKRPGTVVLVTDGLENCGLNACALGTKLHAEAPQLKVHVIGFRIGSRSEQSIACLAQATGGTYTSVEGYEDLRRALRVTLSCPKIS